MADYQNTLISTKSYQDFKFDIDDLFLSNLLIANLPHSKNVLNNTMPVSTASLKTEFYNIQGGNMWAGYFRFSPL